MSNICRIFYNFSSLLFCCIICLIKSFALWCIERWNILYFFNVFIFSLLTLISIISWRVFLKFQTKIEIKDAKIDSIATEPFDIYQYLITCFIPLLTEEPQEMIFIITIYILLMLRKQVVCFNPIIWLKGYNVYTVTLTKGIDNTTFISKKTIKRKPTCIVYSELYNGFLIDRSEEEYEEC